VGHDTACPDFCYELPYSYYNWDFIYNHSLFMCSWIRLTWQYKNRCRITPMGISAAFSGILSAIFTNKVDEQVLSKIMGIVFVVLGIFMTAFLYLF